MTRRQRQMEAPTTTPSSGVLTAAGVRRRRRRRIVQLLGHSAACTHPPPHPLTHTTPPGFTSTTWATLCWWRSRTAGGWRPPLRLPTRPTPTRAATLPSPRPCASGPPRVRPRCTLACASCCAACAPPRHADACPVSLPGDVVSCSLADIQRNTSALQSELGRQSVCAHGGGGGGSGRGALTGKFAE